MYLGSSGQRLLDGVTGVSVLEVLLGQERGHHLVMVGDRARIDRFLGAADTRQDQNPSAPSASRKLLDRIKRELCESTSEVLEIPLARLDLGTTLSDFGFDSVSLAHFAEVLSQRLGVVVTPDVFFGYPTLGRLAGYLVERSGESIARHLGLDSVDDASCSEAAQTESSTSNGPAEPDSAATPEGTCASVMKQPLLPQQATSANVSVVGMAGRFPGVGDVAGLWRVLVGGGVVTGGLPDARVGLWSGFGVDGVDGVDGVVGGFVSGVDEFDPLFFEISPREALGMDPRQRLVLEECWRGWEDAGLTAALVGGRRVGVLDRKSVV